jgi:hypothetical protein
MRLPGMREARLNPLSTQLSQGYIPASTKRSAPWTLRHSTCDEPAPQARVSSVEVSMTPELSRRLAKAINLAQNNGAISPGSAAV